MRSARWQAWYLVRAGLAGIPLSAGLAATTVEMDRNEGFGQLPWLYATGLLLLGGGWLVMAAARLPLRATTGLAGPVAALVVSRLALALMPYPYDLGLPWYVFQPVGIVAGGLAFAAVAWFAAGQGTSTARIVAGTALLGLIASMIAARGPVTDVYREQAIARLGVPPATVTVPGARSWGADVNWPRDRSPGRGRPALRQEFVARYDDATYVRLYLWGSGAPVPEAACRTAFDPDEFEDLAGYSPCRDIGGGRWQREDAKAQEIDLFATYRGALVRVAGSRHDQADLLRILAGLHPVPPDRLARHWQEPTPSEVAGLHP